MDRRLWVCLRTRFITTASVSRHLGVQGIMVNHYRPQVKIKGTLPHILHSRSYMICCNTHGYLGSPVYIYVATLFFVAESG